jgi:hypothetical protein
MAALCVAAQFLWLSPAVLAQERATGLSSVSASAASAATSPAAECDPKKAACDGLDFHVLFENDLFSEALGFGHSDRWYTNGIKLMLTRQGPIAPLQLLADAADTVRPLASRLLGDPENVQSGYAAGQLMFTPANILQATPQPSDRFWGAFLYVGSIVQTASSSTRGKIVTDDVRTAEVDVGFIGPPALGDQTQTEVHRAFGYNLPRGWSNQLPAEAAIQATYVRSIRWGGSAASGLGRYVDVSTHRGFSVGTLFDSVNAGFTARIGSHLAGVPVGTIERPSLANFKPTANNFYGMIGFDLKAVAHNTFVDGSLFRAAPYASQMRSKPLVAQSTVGVVAELVDFPIKRISFLINRRSPEFTAPGLSAQSQTFATMLLELHFK